MQRNIGNLTLSEGNRLAKVSSDNGGAAMIKTRAPLSPRGNPSVSFRGGGRRLPRIRFANASDESIEEARKI